MVDEQVGFECVLVEKPPKSFQSECPVCLLVLREPYQVTCCGYAFCRVCIEKHKQDNKLCPCCKKTFDIFEDKRLKRSLYQFKVYCTNKYQGCQWEGELGQLDNHLNYNPTEDKQLEGCEFAKIKCHYCSDIFQRSDIQLHQRYLCLTRPFTCKYCGYYTSSYKVVSGIHWPVCDYYPLPCTNKCGKTLERQNLQSHITTDCPLTIIDCDFQHVGCEVRLPRKDMPAHLQEGVVRHVSLQAVSYKQVIATLKDISKKQQKELTRLEQENAKLKQYIENLTQHLQSEKSLTSICPVEFTITNFERRRKDKECWRSPPFYTHLKGYKMCAYVYNNGCKTGARTHVSVTIRIMKGDFDDQLEWPFQGSIEIQLLSQDQDNVHHKRNIVFDSQNMDGAGNRVTDKEISKCEHGLFKFISHSDIRPKYLNINDCLKFRFLTFN